MHKTETVYFPFGAKEFDPSCSNLRDIAQQLHRELNTLMFGHFVYSGVPFRFHQDMTAPPDLKVFQFRHVSSCRTSLSSNPETIASLQQYLRQCAHDCADFRRVIRIADVHIHPGPEAAGEKAQMMGYNKQMRSITTWHMRSLCSGYWGGMFRLYSPLEPAELQHHMHRVRHRLYQLLNHTHMELMAHYRDQFNPYLNMGVFCDNAMQTLQLTAEGFSTKEISTKLELSERGVDYHIEKMRIKLQARNRMHLIAIASQAGMVKEFH